MPDVSERSTEQHYRCPNCKVPRFLAAASRGLVGTLRLKCPKCRKTETFDLPTGRVLKTVTVRSRERELRCGAGGCGWFLGGVIIESGHGHVRIQCPRRRDDQACKRNNRFSVQAAIDDHVELPTS